MKHSYTVNDFYINFNWEFYLEAPSFITDKYSNILPQLNDNSIYFKNTSLPSVSSEFVDFTYTGDAQYIVKSGMDVDNFTINVLCDSELLIFKMFKDWHKLRYAVKPSKTVVGLLNLPSTYQGVIINYLKANNEDRDVLFETEFIGIYPSSIGDLVLGTEEGEIGSFDVTFKFTDVNEYY